MNNNEYLYVKFINIYILYIIQQLKNYEYICMCVCVCMFYINNEYIYHVILKKLNISQIYIYNIIIYFMLVR
jgi:hypothetical protein